MIQLGPDPFCIRMAVWVGPMGVGHFGEIQFIPFWGGYVRYFDYLCAKRV